MCLKRTHPRDKGCFQQVHVALGTVPWLGFTCPMSDMEYVASFGLLSCPIFIIFLEKPWPHLSFLAVVELIHGHYEQLVFLCPSQWKVHRTAFINRS